jgi:hypothetical protein
VVVDKTANATRASNLDDRVFNMNILQRDKRIE